MEKSDSDLNCSDVVRDSDSEAEEKGNNNSGELGSKATVVT